MLQEGVVLFILLFSMLKRSRNGVLGYTSNNPSHHRQKREEDKNVFDFNQELAFVLWNWDDHIVSGLDFYFGVVVMMPTDPSTFVLGHYPAIGWQIKQERTYNFVGDWDHLNHRIHWIHDIGTKEPYLKKEVGSRTPPQDLIQLLFDKNFWDELTFSMWKTKIHIKVYNHTV